MSYAVEEIATNNVVASFKRLPRRIRLPGGTTDVDQVGQTWPNPDPVYRVIEVVDLEPSPVSLEALREDALRGVDDQFAVTMGTNPSLSKVHRMKSEEAEEVLANGVDDPADFPLLSASKLEDESLEDAAARIRGKFREDEQRLAQLEAIRLTAKTNIRRAQSVEDLERVQASIDWTVK